MQLAWMCWSICKMLSLYKTVKNCTFSADHQPKVSVFDEVGIPKRRYLTAWEWASIINYVTHYTFKKVKLPLSLHFLVFILILITLCIRDENIVCMLIWRHLIQTCATFKVIHKCYKSDLERLTLGFLHKCDLSAYMRHVKLPPIQCKGALDMGNNTTYNTKNNETVCLHF